MRRLTTLCLRNSSNKDKNWGVHSTQVIVMKSLIDQVLIEENDPHINHHHQPVFTAGN
jgi:hypothetical protein